MEHVRASIDPTARLHKMVRDIQKNLLHIYTNFFEIYMKCRMLKYTFQVLITICQLLATMNNDLLEAFLFLIKLICQVLEVVYQSRPEISHFLRECSYFLYKEVQMLVPQAFLHLLQNYPKLPLKSQHLESIRKDVSVWFL